MGNRESSYVYYRSRGNGMTELSDSKADVDRAKTWTDEEVLQLIKCYEEFAFLWDSTHPYYRNKDQKAKALEELGGRFECSSQEIQRKLHNLRNQVNQEINKIKIRRSRGGSEENCTSSWKYFPALQFLLPSIQAKASQPNLGTSLCETQLVIVDNIAEENTKFQIVSSDRAVEQKLNRRRRRRNASDDDDSLLEENDLWKRRKDDFEQFGEYVALELRSLRSDFYRRKLKSEIRKAIVRITDEEDSQY